MKISKYILLVYFFLLTNLALADGDSLLKAMETCASANRVQSERMKIAAENTANEFSTSMQPGGEPYRRKVLYVRNKYDKRVKTNIVTVKKIDLDKKTPFILKYDPNHPAADLNGYVKFPNVSKEIEAADAREANISYNANLNIMEMTKSMMEKTLEVIK